MGIVFELLNCIRHYFRIQNDDKFDSPGVGKWFGISNI